jgi:hypothetical protein
MPKNQDSLNSDLFALLQSRGYSPVLLDTSGKEVPVPDEAEVFQFNFVKNDEDYGTVTLSIDGLHKLVVYFDDKVADSPKERSDTGEENWYTLLKRLKNFARTHQLSFEIRNTDKLRYDMKQRDHLKQLDESYHAVSKHKSYNDNIPETKIVIQHSKVMEEGEQRFRHVDKIFIENMLGERILAPTTKPGIAQVYARHLAEGGKPHDIRWQHIGAMVEEYSKMAGFVRATRGNQFNESAQRLVNEGLNHYQKLRECLSKMRGKRGYNTYFESWTPPLMEDEESVDLSEMFMQSSLDPRIESVMPILGKLSKNLGEAKDMAEVIALENWADSIMTQEAKEEEADYGDEYQSDVLTLKQKAQAQEKKKPVDITALARRLKSVMDKDEKEVSEEQFGPAATAAIQQGRPPNEVHYADTGDKMNAEFHKIAMREQGVAEEAQNKDMTGQTCEKCKKGKYQERSQYDDMEGKVTCKCGHRVDRWKKYKEQGVAEGFFGIDDKIKGKIQNIVSRLSDEYGMWDHKAQTFTPDGLEHLKSILKFNDKYIKYALSLTSRDFEAEGVAEGAPELLKAEMPLVRHIEQELTKIGYKKGTPEFNAYFNDAIKFYRQFGNFGFNKNQGVAEGSLNEMDKSQPSSDRGGESSGNPYAKGSKATPIKAKDFAKKAGKELDKAMDKAHPDYDKHEKKLISKMSNAEKADKGWRNPNVKEGQEDLEAILRIIKK